MDHVLEPIVRTLHRVLDMPLETCAPESGRFHTPDHEFVVSLGVATPAPGTVVATFPRDTAYRIASLFAGHEIASEDDAEIADAIAEIIDIAASRAGLRDPDHPCPLVTVRHSLADARIPARCQRTIECFCNAGEFSLGFVPVPQTVGRITPASPPRHAPRTGKGNTP